MGDDAACTDDRTLADGDATADHRVGADPDILLQRDGGGGADAFRAMGSVNGVAGAGQTDTGRNESPGTDMDRGGIQNDAVVVDDVQPVGVDIETVITVECRLNEGQVGAVTEQLFQDFPAALLLVRGQLIVLPAKPLHVGLPFRGKITVLPRIASGRLRISS